MERQNFHAIMRYRVFDIGLLGDLSDFTVLENTLRLRKLQCFSVDAGNSPEAREYYAMLSKYNGQSLEIETQYLLHNQWNAAPPSNLRVFDWARYQYPNKNLIAVQWLELPDEAYAMRQEWLACGYCGHLVHESERGNGLCTHCPGNDQLTPSDFHLLRLLPVAVSLSSKRAPLSAEEREWFEPWYDGAQAVAREHGRLKRLVKARKDVERELQRKIGEAQTKADIFGWLLDHEFLPDSVIWYAHAQRVCFGWDKPLEADVVSVLLDIISEFPWSYDIKCADGRVLSGER